MAGYLEFVLAGVVPLLLASALWARLVAWRQVPARLSRHAPASAAHRHGAPRA